MHLQSDSLSLASGALEFAGQSLHPSDVAPTTVEYWPLSQFLHAASPGAILYFPAMQLVQVPPLGPVELALQMQSTCLLLDCGAFEFVTPRSH